MTNRITSLEAQVSELEATVKALTADLVEAKSRLNELEDGQSASSPPPEMASESRGSMAFSPEDDAAIVDQYTGVMGQAPTPSAEDNDTATDDEPDGDIVIA
jgi:predicted nuclease with TOPRIM domain